MVTQCNSVQVTEISHVYGHQLRRGDVLCREEAVIREGEITEKAKGTFRESERTLRTARDSLDRQESQTIGRSTNQQIHQPTNQLINQPTNQSSHQAINQPITSINQPIIRPIGCSRFTKILLGRKTYNYCYETDELPISKANPTQPMTNYVNCGIWATFSHSKQFFVGWD